MARYQGGETSIMLGNTADYAVVHLVSPGFFDALGVRVAAGRLLNADEEQPGGPLAAVISHGFWNQRFNGDAKAIGATIKVDSRIFTIVGVLAPGLRFPARVDVFVPSWIAPVRSTRGGHNYRAIARLNDGVTVEQARDEILAIARRLEQEYPDTNKDKHAERGAAEGAAWSATAGPCSTMLLKRVGGRAADCLRQRRQPAAGTGVGARPRDGRPGSGRRRPVAADPPAADREPAARR